MSNVSTPSLSNAKSNGRQANRSRSSKEARRAKARGQRSANIKKKTRDDQATREIPEAKHDAKNHAKPDTNCEGDVLEGEVMDPGHVEAGHVEADQLDADVLVADIIQQLHEGNIQAEDLPTAVRRACVGHMTDEGYSGFEIAVALSVTDRTVFRDRAALRKANAIAPGLQLGDEMLGEMQRLTYNAIQKLTRLINAPDASQYTRMWASEATCRVYERFMKMANAMEYAQLGGGRLRKLNAKQPGFDPLAGPASKGELDVLRRLMKVE